MIKVLIKVHDILTDSKSFIFDLVLYSDSPWREKIYPLRWIHESIS